MSETGKSIVSNRRAQKFPGKWKIDLRMSRDAEADYQTMEVIGFRNGSFTGVFNGIEIEDGLINTSLVRRLYFAFSTSNQSGKCYHSGYISSGLMSGISYCPGKGYTYPWSGRKFFRHENDDWEEEIPSLDEEQLTLIDQVKDAFKDVKLDYGVSLHGTVVIDAFGFEEDIRRWYEWDESEDWTNLIYNPELRAVSGSGGLSFYDIRGMKFHLPAYLCAAILWPYENIAFDLVSKLTNMSDYNLKNFRVLNSAQKKAVESFLYYIISIPEGYYYRDHAKIQLAIDQFWYTQD